MKTLSDFAREAVATAERQWAADEDARGPKSLAIPESYIRRYSDEELRVMDPRLKAAIADEMIRRAAEQHDIIAAERHLGMSKTDCRPAASLDECMAAMERGEGLRYYQTAKGRVGMLGEVSTTRLVPGVSLGLMTDGGHSTAALESGLARYSAGAGAHHHINDDGTVETTVPIDAPKDEKGRWEHNRQMIEKRQKMLARLRGKLAAKKA